MHTNIVNRSTRAVRYFIAADAYSSGNRTAELNAVRASFDQWQSVPGTILRFEEAGLMAGQPDVNTQDNTNVVFWAKTSTVVNGGLDNISGYTGVTFFDSFSDGTLAEADIALNGVQFSWFTDFSNTINQAQFVEGILLHEIGHLIGLAHSPVGGATMYARGGNGLNVQAGLSADEIAAAQSLYPNGSIGPTLGRLTGKVTLNGNGVFGALVFAEDAAGNLISGTVTRANGQYDMPALPPGRYQVRVTPVDPANANPFLMKGGDIGKGFTTAEANFLPTVNTLATLAAGATAPLNFTLGENPTFRIAKIRPPVSDPDLLVVINYPATIRRGDANQFVGVYSPNLLTSNATLRISGDGITLGATTFKPNAFPGGYNLISVPISVAADATPGLRTFILQQDNNLAYANGFLEIQPDFPDHNFDGFDDYFQRQYFPRWTVPEAGPNADPDRDGYNNFAEYISGSVPTNAASVLRVESVRTDASGATVTWPSAPGKRYQLFSRTAVNSIRGWQAVGSPVMATGNVKQVLDPSATNGVRFYKIQALP